MDKYLRANLKSWNARVPVHAASRFYDVEGFLRGRNVLLPIERREVGPVKGKRLLHLQCHFGMDTLSWARLGARVTGADFSDKAIDKARDLAARAGLKADFVLADIMRLPRVLKAKGKFDIVFASYGVICWISDIKRWVRVAAHFLKPGGFLCLAESHPFTNILAMDGRSQELPYFNEGPAYFPPEYTYTDGPQKAMPPTYEWCHPMADILGAVKTAGLRLDSLKEYPYCAWERFRGMKKGRDGFYRLPASRKSLPLLFSLKAVKEKLR